MGFQIEGQRDWESGWIRPRFRVHHPQQLWLVPTNNSPAEPALQGCLPSPVSLPSCQNPPASGSQTHKPPRLIISNKSSEALRLAAVRGRPGVTVPRQRSLCPPHPLLRWQATASPEFGTGASVVEGLGQVVLLPLSRGWWHSVFCFREELSFGSGGMGYAGELSVIAELFPRPSYSMSRLPLHSPIPCDAVRGKLTR